MTEATALFVLGLVVLAVVVGSVTYVTLTYSLQYLHCRLTSAETAAPRAYLRAWATESLAVTLIVLTYPLGWIPVRRWQPYDPSGGPVVVLVHGYAVNRASMLLAAYRLRRLGYRNVYSISLVPTTRPVAELGQQLSRQLAALSAHCGGREIIGIGHSLGGLVLRWCDYQRPPPPLTQIITIGSPHHGTWLAKLGLDAAARDLRPDSPFLCAIDKPVSLPLTAIYSRLDNMVFPVASAAFGSRVVSFAGYGHDTLLLARDVFDAVRAAIATRPSRS